VALVVVLEALEVVVVGEVVPQEVGRRFICMKKH